MPEYIYSLSDTRPDSFHPFIECAGSYCTLNGRLLFLKRHADKPFGNAWGVPGGKLEPGESPLMAMVRETYEEVGITVDPLSAMPIRTLYIHLPNNPCNVIYHMFYVPFAEMPELKLHLDEHVESQWIFPKKAMQLPVVVGGIEALEYYIAFLNDLLDKD